MPITDEKKKELETEAENLKKRLELSLSFINDDLYTSAGLGSIALLVCDSTDKVNLLEMSTELNSDKRHWIMASWNLCGRLRIDWERRKARGFDPPHEETELLNAYTNSLYKLMQYYKINPSRVGMISESQHI